MDSPPPEFVLLYRILYAFITHLVMVLVLPSVQKALGLKTTGPTAIHARLVRRLEQDWDAVITLINVKWLGRPPRCDHFPKFLSLPPEVRDLVFDFAMYDLPTRCNIPPWHPLSKLVVLPRTLPNIAFTSKQIHKDVLHAWLRRTRLVVISAHETSASLKSFLTEVDGLDHVRMLSLHDLDTFGGQTLGLRPSALVAACPGITRLDIGLNATAFLDVPGLKEKPIRITLCSPKALGEVLKLNSVIGIKRLQVLTLTISCRAVFIPGLLEVVFPLLGNAIVNLKVVLEDILKEAIASGRFKVRIERATKKR